MEREYQKKLFKLEVDFEHQLNSAKQFRDLSKQLREKFDSEGIVVSKKASIKKKSKNEWRILDKFQRDIEAYYLTLNYNDITERRRLYVRGDTPSGKSDIIWDYHIFRSHIDVREVFDDKWFSCENREKLTAMQRQKWDFFFRPIKIKVGKYQRKKLKKVQEELNQIEEELRVATIVLAITLLTIFMGAWKNGSVGMLIVISVIILVSLMKYLSNIDIIALLNTWISKKKWIRAYEDEIYNLESQIDEIVVPSSSQIVKSLEKEIYQLNTEAVRKLSIDKATVQTPDSDSNPLNLCGISLFSHAIFQPDFQRVIFNRLGKQTQNFYGYRPYKNGYMPSGWYMTFTFLDHKRVCISGFYYDFILGQRVNQLNKEYFYEDLIGNSVNTNRVDDPFDNQDGKTVEVDVVKMSFRDSRKIAISLKNIKTYKDIQERIKDQESMGEFEARSLIEDDDEKLIAKLILSKTNADTNADKMVKHVRKKLDEVKDKIKFTQ